MTVPKDRGSLVKIKDETEYYPHQLEGIRRMARMGSLILADDMGLGKSLQALTVAAIDFEMGKANRVIVVCPATLKGNWVNEILDFTHFTHTVLQGTPAQRKKQIDEFDADVLIVNYEQMAPHVADFNRMGFGVAIYDEAHAIKNHKAKRTKACHKLAARRHLILTGSPLLNQINDLWSLLHMVDPAEYPKYWGFVQRYAVFGGYMDKEIVGVKNQAELTERLHAVMIRRRKSDVLDLPEKQVIPVFVDLHPEQRRLYKQAVDELQIEIPNDPNPMELENALTRFLRLKQICGTTAAIPGHADHSTKLDRAEEMIDEIVLQNGEHVVVFTQFRTVQNCLADRLAQRGISRLLLHGDVPAPERVPLVTQWASGPPAALLAGLQVAGVGLNMTAASKCIFIDKLFVPKLNEQAEDRLHRIGADKTKPIQVFELIAANTIEQRIELILRRKRKVFDTLVEESDWKKRLIEALMEEDDL